MGIAKSDDTASGARGGSRIRSSIASTAEAIGSAIEKVGTFFALAVTSALALASTVATWGPTVSMDQADESVVRLPFSASPVSYIVTLILAAALIASCVAWCRRRGKAEIAPWMPIAALAIAVAISTAAQIWWVAIQHIDSTGYYDGHLLQYFGRILSAGDPEGVMSYSPGVPFISQEIGTRYMMCYPYQSGLVLLWSWLYSAFGDGAVTVFTGLNIAMNELSIVSIYAIGTAVARTHRSRVLLAFLLGAFLPHILYSGFIYGNQIGFGLACSAAALSSVAMRSGSPSRSIAAVAVSSIPAAISLWAKSTFVIVLIAVGIIWLIAALSRRNLQTVATAAAFAAVLAIACSASGIPKRTFEGRVGYDIGDGIPTIAWFEIGLGDESTIGEGMPGWYFPISLGNFAASNGDPDETARRALSGLSAELERLTGDPAYALRFFTTKIGGEWLTPDFESRFFGGQCNYSIDDDAGTPLNADDDEISRFRRTPRRYVNYRTAKEISEDDWFGNASPEEKRRAVEIEKAWDGIDGTVQYMDAYQTATYALAAIAAATLFASSVEPRGRERDDERDPSWPASLIPACVFAVGFFVYLLWEAKAQYTEPFFMFLIPMAACGAEKIADLLDRIADGSGRRIGLHADRNRSIPAPYVESPAVGRTAVAPDTPSDPLRYSTGGQSDVRYDSRNLARTGDAMHADGGRVLRKGRCGGERTDLITPRRDGQRGGGRAAAQLSDRRY